MKIAKLFTISGYVQGVGYRYFAIREATKLGIYGYAKNLPDGDVEVYAIGTEEQLAQFKEKLKIGPYSSRVSDIVEKRVPVNNSYTKFDIEY